MINDINTDTARLAIREEVRASILEDAQIDLLSEITNLAMKAFQNARDEDEERQLAMVMSITCDLMVAKVV